MIRAEQGGHSLIASVKPACLKQDEIGASADSRTDLHRMEWPVTHKLFIITKQTVFVERKTSPVT